ncbi:phenylalanine--tRNA ligase subunit beta [Candidatus Roizmanbacteria bacterium RIFCSPLOWO2_01_FULL_41_22]|uniref:Phenylalanine--tRNA ligase beta subunit n=2 Tax=Candidatus Roizmaniibacteriota TaxID=1752723 RepID=A0A1F7JQP5_9BACT|nr:MAG: phenylalanine--tRNA ligase subunit beta [Candidatus Roizmanbacteria bacterium RIFCSPLOWO2_01_FULL_41_22]OGK57926.1 MAG: phenylalanine--tRNA ligase subunit beta [Candidatus Roizmanbacteria bacterium RIFCSPLOWO2_02_FULL_41_9]
MNIKITYNWLLEYLETDADPYELQKYLSLCGPSIERVQQIGVDYVLDIEVTTNRVETASVFGIAQEATAILPQFGKKAKLKINPLQKYTFSSMNTKPGEHMKLDITIADHNLCPRFTAIVYKDINIKPAPDLIKQRLQMCDIKSINNIVDISNYLMLSLGQPVHMFDYDKIIAHKMILRESKKGEKITTLDEKEIILPGGDIVIEDGSGRLIDLCGIMGGLNSAINNKTTTIVFFIQNYDKKRIRRTSMITGQRTVAATYFEKGLDPQRVETTFVYGIDLLNELSGGISASPLYDIYPHPYQIKEINVTLDFINRLIGVSIEQNKVKYILENLGFKVEIHHNEDYESFHIKVPSYRSGDVDIKEDIVEEVARVYGYHNLNNAIQPTIYVKQPRDIEMLFVIQQKIKYFLKHLGLNEMMNYSMISKELIDKLALDSDNKLVIDNSISEEIRYMRTSLIPSLIKNIKDNENKKDKLKFFEIAKIYEKKESLLPNEIYRLGLATNTDFFDLKGIIQALLNELNISEYQIIRWESKHYLPSTSVEWRLADIPAIRMGQIKKTYQEAMGIKSSLFVAEIEFSALIKNYQAIATFKPLSPYAIIKLDLNLKHNQKQTYDKIRKTAFATTPLLTNVELLDLYKGKITLRFYFSSSHKNLTEEEVKKELQKIQNKLQ